MGLLKRFADAIEIPTKFEDEGGMPVLDRDDVLARADRMEIELKAEMRRWGLGETAVRPEANPDVRP